MTDQTDLARQLSAAFAAIFSDLQLDPRHATLIRPARADLAAFQCNGAMALAKAMGRKPQELAAAIAARWNAKNLAENVTVAGVGFLNIRVSAEALSARAQQIHDDTRAGG